MSHNLKGGIMTVKGPVKSEELGYCQSHEHLFLADGQSAKVNPALRIDDYDKTLSELKLYKSCGGKSIVDAQPVGCGRMAEFLYKASVEAEVNIIASTGFHKLIFYPKEHWIHNMDKEFLSELFIKEFEEGMYADGDVSLPKKHTRIRPGVIKTASDKEGVYSKYKDLFTAAAKASVVTGMPVLSHTEMGKGALDQVEIFTKNGIPEDSIIICHLDRNVQDRDYHLEVAKTGVYMEYDTIGRHKYHSDEDEAAFIVKMVEAGYEDKILLGLDTTRQRLKSYGGSIGLDYIFKTFIPMLKSYGLKDQTIRKFVKDNPAKAFRNYKNRG